MHGYYDALITIYFKKAVRIISMKLHYMSRHVKVIYWFKEMEVALPPFFQKNIVVGIMIYSIGKVLCLI